MCDDIVGIQPKDMGRVQLALEAQLTQLSKTGVPLNAQTIAAVLEANTRIKENSIFNAAEIQIFFRETHTTVAGPCVKCRIKDKDGPRTYYALFSFEKDEFGGFPIKVFTDNEFKRSSAFMKGVPQRKAQDALAIDRYIQHEKGLDAVIALAHEKGLAKEPLKNIFDYSVEVKRLLSDLDANVSNPAGLISIENRKFYLIPLNSDIIGAMRSLPKTRVVDANGVEYEVEYSAHSSNNAVHLFVSQETYYHMTAGDSLGELGARSEVMALLAHEIGVMGGLSVTDMIGSDRMRQPRNAADDKYHSYLIKRNIAKQSHLLQPLNLTLVDLDKNLTTRDYAAGSKMDVEQPRNADGTFAERPGKNTKSALRVIAMTPSLQSGGFTVQDYLEAYSILREGLSYDKLAANPEKTARNDLNGLVSQGLLTVTKENKYNTYILTSDGRGAVKKMSIGSRNEDKAIDSKIAGLTKEIRDRLAPMLQDRSDIPLRSLTEDGSFEFTLSDGTKMVIDRDMVNTIIANLPGVLKEYDVRGLDNIFTPEMLVVLGIAIGTSRFNSHHGMEGLNAGDMFFMAGDNGPTTPKMRKYIAEGLRLTGVNVVDFGLTIGGELYNGIFRLGAQGGAYVTRSHVEVGTNGFKPLVGNTTLYADMIQVMGQTIKNGEFRIASSDKAGRIITADSDLGKAIHDLSRDIYRLNLIKEFSRIQDVMKNTGMKVGIDFGGGSATQYVSLAKEMLGDRLVATYGTEQDPTCKNGLPDPSREDQLQDIIDLSKKDPKVIWFSYDLDTDRMAIVWNGRLFKGDLLFYPVVENVLFNGDGMQKEFLYDARMSPAIAELVQKLGGVAKIHPKGHSKIKKSVELMMKALAKERGYASVLDLVQATNHHDFQMEYSLHPFVTTEKGACIDDAFRFTFWWIDAFAAMRKAYGSDLTLDNYIEGLQKKGVISKWYSLSEQRTDMQEEFKKDIINKMRDTIIQAFEGRDSFEFVNWQNYKGQTKPFTLVDTEGVYYFMTPLGIFYWGWSNTSAKIAFGAHSKNDKDLKALARMMFSVFYSLRDDMQAAAQAKGVKVSDASRHIQDKETKDLLALMGGKKNTEVENSIKAEYPTRTAALDILMVTGVGRIETTAVSVKGAGAVLPGNSEIGEMLKLAGQAGLEIPTHPNSCYQLLVTSEFFANGELGAHKLKYGDRFDLNVVSGSTSQQFVDNVLAKAKGKEDKTIALVPDFVSFKELARLKMAGTRFIRVSATDLLDAKAQKDQARESFQLDTYAMMLLVRSLSDKTAKDSNIYRVLSFYVKSHFKFDGTIAVDDYINAIVKSDISTLIKGYLSYKPTEAYRVPEYNTIAAALISA
jgi:phosphomannomutase